VLSIRDARGYLAGTRKLDSDAPDCAAIEAASVLAIALAIDPDAMTRSRPPGSPPVVPSPSTRHLSAHLAEPQPPNAIAPVEAERGAELAPASPAGPRWLETSGFGLRGSASLGLLPRPAAGVALAGQVGVGEPVELTGEALFVPQVSTNDARFGFGLSALALGACVELVRSAHLDLGACGAIWAGAVHAVVLTPFYFMAPGDYAWAAASAMPRLRLALGSRVYAEVGTQLVVPLVRTPFEVKGSTTPAFQQYPVAALPFLGVGVGFP
jgi:hypothetical protein